jgi:hypothetical protein
MLDRRGSKEEGPTNAAGPSLDYWTRMNTLFGLLRW